jgi:hypothetical protein
MRLSYWSPSGVLEGDYSACLDDDRLMLTGWECGVWESHD